MYLQGTDRHMNLGDVWWDWVEENTTVAPGNGQKDLSKGRKDTSFLNLGFDYNSSLFFLLKVWTICKLWYFQALNTTKKTHKKNKNCTFETINKLSLLPISRKNERKKISNHRADEKTPEDGACKWNTFFPLVWVFLFMGKTLRSTQRILYGLRLSYC